jgi:lysophospholipid acyltransferase (LPLAT)-like uncharacterized protein
VKIEGRLARWLIALLFPLFRLWSRTITYTIDDRCGLRTASMSWRVIGALWHNRLLLFPYAIWRFVPQRRASAALISASRDGDIIADVVRRFGFRPVRGSTSRKGTGAVLEIADVLAAGTDVLITPDGPRGPAYRVGPGIIFLAQKTGVPIMPINIEYSSCWRARNWDRFIVPKPFSSVHVTFADLHYVAQTSSDEEFEAERKRLEDVLMGLVQRR